MKKPNTHIPILTIDGPSGSGKGTVGKIIAQKLGWHFLDSGAMYRLLGFAALKEGVSLDDAARLAVLAGELKIKFDDGVFLENQEVTQDIRAEKVGLAASKVAKLPKVREALLRCQRDFLKLPGLVTDGRDMGTVVFPEAKVKIFLEASCEERANRRYKQLKEQGINVNLGAILHDLEARDARDRERAVSPLKPAQDAIVIDTTNLSIDDVVEKIMQIL